MEHNSMKAKLLDIVQRAYEDELAFVAGLSHEERNAIGSLAQQSAKDVISHIASWMPTNISSRYRPLCLSRSRHVARSSASSPSASARACSKPRPLTIAYGCPASCQ